MSLSFVSKAIQTSTEDGGFEEKPIESSEGAGSSTASTGEHLPLFEQLRRNQEKDDAERDELQRTIMRSTLALNEEDAAHLDALAKHKADQEAIRQQHTQNELQAFRAAKAGLMEQKHTVQGETSGLVPEERKEPMAKKQPAKIVPTIVKKRRRSAADVNNDEKHAKAAEEMIVSDMAEGEGTHVAETETAGALGLLAGYGSDSDES